MTQIKYSVIIPVYNAERTLKRCLDSLLGQKREDVEIILINDGSSDGSRAILEDYGRRFPNVRAVHQENAGVSAARNRGLDEAEGKYITFVDSDDYVSEDYFRAMDEAGEKEDSDLIVFAKDIAGQGIDESNLYKKMCAASSLQEKREILLSSRIIFQPQYKRFPSIYTLRLSPSHICQRQPLSDDRLFRERAAQQDFRPLSGHGPSRRQGHVLRLSI